MFSSWFGSKTVEPEKKQINNPKIPASKPPVSKPTQWQQDILGDWKRVAPSKPSVRGLQGAQLDDTPPVDDTQIPIPDPIPATDEQSYDELAKFQRKLRVKIFTLEKLLEDLEQTKIDIIGDIKGNEIQSPHPACPNGKLKKLSSRIFHAVKECIEPAGEELDDLLNEVRPHLTDLSAHINILCESLNEPVEKASAGHHKTDAEKRQAGIEICDSCIELATELKDFLASILAEIDLCLQSEKLGEIALNMVIQFAIFLATSRTLGFNLTFAQPYRNNLNERIEQEKIDIEIFETDAIGTLKKASNTLKQMQNELASGQTLKVSGTGLFAAKKDQSVATQIDLTQKPLQPAM